MFMNKAKKEPAEDVEKDLEVIVEDAETSPEEDPLLEKQKVIAELNDKYLRKLAEFDNYQKRTTKEKIARYDDGTRDTISKLLPIIDNFERAFASEKDKTGHFYKGIELIYRQILGYLDDIGVEEIPAKGKAFDPNIHTAVSHMEDEQYGENEVIEVLQKGYSYKDRVIRPSTVVVAN